MLNETQKPMLRPAIVIGLGGTGNQVVRRLKKFIQDQYRETPIMLNFLVVDTDQKEFRDQDWHPLPELSELEKLDLHDPQVPFAEVRKNPGAYPEIHEWLLPGLDVGALDSREGAGQVRMLGRAAFYKSFDFFARRMDHLFGECQKIRTKLEALQRYDFDVETDPVIYIVSSTCGGQGAGSLIDVAVALRVLAERFARLNLIGILSLPSAYERVTPRDNWRRVCANAHAVMKEVDYLMHTVPGSKMRFHFPRPISRWITPQAPLFDVCYLVDIAHQHGSLNNMEEVFDQIATQIFLEIGTPFGARSDSVRRNLDTVSGLERDAVYKTGRRYSGFGNHTITFNREKIVELAALKSTYSLLHDTLIGRGLTTDEMDKAADEFVARHRVDESRTDDLVNSLITTREIAQEQFTQAWAQDRADHVRFAEDLWSRLDAFWTRRSHELGLLGQSRAREKLDGGTDRLGMLGDIDRLIDRSVREKGVTAAVNFAEVLLSRLRSFEELMRSEQADLSSRAQNYYEDAERARAEISTVAHQLEALQNREERLSLFSRVWQAIRLVVTLGRQDGPQTAERLRQIQALIFRVREQRDLLRQRANQAIECRLAAQARDAAASLYSECISRLTSFVTRLRSIHAALENASRLFCEQTQSLNTDIKRNRFVGGNTMRRDVTADYADQYQQMHASAFKEQVVKWLLPTERLAIDSLEGHPDPTAIQDKFRQLYAQDILDRADRDSLAQMIDRVHTHGSGGSLTERIEEGLRFCLPFWDIRVPGTQHPTQVLLLGIDEDHPALHHFLEDYAVRERGQVYAQVVPTGQDSVILISRIAHGASYYWHADDEKFFREYCEALLGAPYPVHLQQDWKTLPEPIPDPRKYERRLFALGIAYEFIAVRGAAYYFDPERQYTLVGSSRQETPDWRTVPLLEAGAVIAAAEPPASPSRASLIDDDNRTEAMQRFVEDEDWVTAVRDKLTDLFNQQGRERVRQQIARYCKEVLEPAINQLAEGDGVRHQLEVELQELEEALDELKRPTDMLKLRR